MKGKTEYNAAWLPDTYCLSSALLFLSLEGQAGLCHFSLRLVDRGGNASLPFSLSSHWSCLRLAFLKHNFHQAGAGPSHEEESSFLKLIFYGEVFHVKCC